jgi:hypothetical protein
MDGENMGKCAGCSSSYDSMRSFIPYTKFKIFLNPHILVLTKFSSSRYYTLDSIFLQVEGTLYGSVRGEGGKKLTFNVTFVYTVTIKKAVNRNSLSPFNQNPPTSPCTSRRELTPASTVYSQPRHQVLAVAVISDHSGLTQ